MRFPGGWPAHAIAMIALGVCGACSGGAAAGADAGLDDAASPDDAGWEVARPAPPVLTPCPEGWEEVPPADPGGVATCEPWPDGDPVTPPADPVLTPCPAGWREETDPRSGTVTCDPWPEAGFDECEAVDEAHFPGEAGCVRIGAACPTGDWAEDLPGETTILYVRAGAAEGGTGTRDAPYATIAEAFGAAAAGTVVAVGRGTYDEAVVVPEGVTLWGACVAETRIACATDCALSSTLVVDRPDAVVRNVQIGGVRQGILVTGGGTLELRDAVVADAVGVGIEVAVLGQLIGRAIAVRSTAAREDGTGAGLLVYTRSSADLERAAFVDNGAIGILVAQSRTTVTLADVVVFGSAGRGLDVESGAEIDATRIVLEKNVQAGAVALETGTVLRLTDAVVSETLPLPADVDARGGSTGINGGTGAVIEGSRVVVEGSLEVGVAADDAGTVVRLADFVVRDTLGRTGDGMTGFGLLVLNGSQVELTNGIIERNRRAGVLGSFPGTTVQMTDVIVRDTRSQRSDGTDGRGLELQQGAEATVERASFDRNRSGGIVAASAGTTVVLTDVAVRDSEGRERDGAYGTGITVMVGARVEIRRGVLERNLLAGVGVGDEGSSASLTDVVIRDTRESVDEAPTGVALMAQDGASVDVDRALFERNRVAGMVFLWPGAVARLSDIVVRDTLATAGPGVGWGDGLILAEGARVEIERALFERNGSAAISLFDAGSSLLLTDAVVRDTTDRTVPLPYRGGRGINVQGGAYLRLLRTVVDGNHDSGIFAGETGTLIEGTDVAVRATGPRSCVHDACAGQGGGTGLVSVCEASIDLRRFLVTESYLCGLQVAHGTHADRAWCPIGGVIDLHEGEVSRNVIGVNVQTEGFDIRRLMDDVIFVDNVRNYDSSALPVPGTSLH